MRNYLEGLSDEALAQHVHNTKAGILKVLVMGEDMHKGDTEKKQCPPEAAAWVGIACLESLEREIARRGMDPTHEVFGIDVLGEMAEIFAEEAGSN